MKVCENGCLFHFHAKTTKGILMKATEKGKSCKYFIDILNHIILPPLSDYNEQEFIMKDGNRIKVSS